MPEDLSPEERMYLAGMRDLLAQDIDSQENRIAHMKKAISDIDKQLGEEDSEKCAYLVNIRDRYKRFLDMGI